MKLILRELSESVIDLEEPEITIVDKKHPERSYVINLVGGYIMLEADYAKDFPRKYFHVTMDSSSEIIEVEMSKEFVDKVVKYGT